MKKFKTLEDLCIHNTTTMKITPELMACAEEIQTEKHNFIRDTHFANLTYEALNDMYILLKLAQLKMQM